MVWGKKVLIKMMINGAFFNYITRKFNHCPQDSLNVMSLQHTDSVRFSEKSTQLAKYVFYSHTTLHPRENNIFTLG